MTTDTSRDRAAELASELTASEVQAVALTWVDNAGITRVKAVPTVRLPEAVTAGVGMSPVFDVYCVDDSITTSAYLGGPVDDLRLYPDLDQIVELCSSPGWAWAPVDRLTQEGDPHVGCSRSYARRMVEAAAAAGLSFQMAFETEWCVGQDTPDGSFVPACSGPAYGMSRVVELSDYLRDLLEALARQGIQADQVHPEYGNGQLELSVGATDPVTAADRGVLVRQTIRAVSHRHGLRASFAPLVRADGVGNGWHLHTSLRSESGENLLAGGSGPYGMGARGEAVLATLLSRLPALSAISAPSVPSKMRLRPQRWAAPYQCWGWENREAALRLVTGTAGHEQASANFELKCVDGSANPYLVVGAVAAIAVAGLDSDAALPREISVDPASIRRADQPPRLPASVADSVAALRADDVLTASFGAPLVEAFVAVREAEAALFAGRQPEDIIAAARWRY